MSRGCNTVWFVMISTGALRQATQADLTVMSVLHVTTPGSSNNMPTQRLRLTNLINITPAKRLQSNLKVLLMLYQPGQAYKFLFA
jgi:hypothetical protein